MFCINQQPPSDLTVSLGGLFASGSFEKRGRALVILCKADGHDRCLFFSWK